MDFLTLSVLLHMHYAENETNINYIQKALEKILDNPLSNMAKCKDYIHLQLSILLLIQMPTIYK